MQIESDEPKESPSRYVTLARPSGKGEIMIFVSGVELRMPSLGTLLRILLHPLITSSHTAVFMGTFPSENSWLAHQHT